MPVAIEQHIEWISDFMQYMREHNIEAAEPEAGSETVWESHVKEAVEPTMYFLANSWYFGANIPGKPRVFTPYAGGMGSYRKRCDEIAGNGYEGFILDSGSRDKAKLTT
jgi:cyclohexanone monooxygenase